VYNAFNRLTGSLVVYRTVEHEWNGLPVTRHEPPGDGFDIESCKLVEIEDLSYSIGDKRILENVSMRIPLAGVIRIGGRSGVGKSTLLELVAGLRRPERGEIFLDGMPMSKVNLGSWWASMSYLSQGAYLFDGSVRENIVLRESGVDQERLLLVADICGLEFLDGSIGFDPEFHIRENGSNLSGGQRARVLLARALYKDAEVMLLDEAFAALDVESARIIMEKMKTSFPGRCIIVVSHRDAELPEDVREYVIE
jgi:ABC-type bacteriocin/lantibiotic exporter with double-glycine peptidase domain